MLHGFHVFLEVGNARLRLGHRVTHGARRLFEVGVERFVVDQRAGSALSSIDLGANRVQVRRRPSCVLDGLLAAIENVACFLEQI